MAFIARMDNSGLGNLSWEFARHLKPEKILLVDNLRNQNFPERYKDFPTRKITRMILKEDRDWLLKDTDVLMSLETFYDWSLVGHARKQGVKTALYTMYEMTRDPIQMRPDIFMCPSELDMSYFPENSVLLPPPLALDRLAWKKRQTAHTFIHTASHGGMNGRKGTQLFLDAIPMVRSDVKFVIYSWFPIQSSDSRVEIRVQNFKNYWQIWREGDVLVYPQDYNGMCLPIQEALASGLAIISTDIFPFNTFLPRELLFSPREMYQTSAAPGLNKTMAARISPEDIAAKIDEWANLDISMYSEYGRDWANKNSWESLYEKYRDSLVSVVQK